MDIKILGPGCKNCATLEARVKEAVSLLHLDATISKVTDFPDIVSYGVLSIPGIVIDEKVVLTGTVPTVKALTALLAEHAQH